MDDGGAGKVVEAHAVEPATTPFPGTRDRIEERDEDRGVGHETGEFDAFGYGTGDDGGRRGGEHGLEDEVRPVGVIGVLGGQVGDIVLESDGATEGDEVVEGTGVHRVEAGEGVGDDANVDDEHILEQDVHRVLLPGQAGFQRGETQMHDEHESRRDQNPQVVDHELGVRQGYGLKPLERGELLAHCLGCSACHDQRRYGEQRCTAKSNLHRGTFPRGMGDWGTSPGAFARRVPHPIRITM